MIIKEIVIFVLFFIAFAIASVTDVKNRTIPIWVFPSAAMLSVIIESITGSFSFIPFLVSFIVPFFILLIFALLGNGGGGDIIMVSFVSSIIGLDKAFLAILIASVIYIITAIIINVIKKGNFASLRKMQLPYAPFFGVGYIVIAGFNLFSEVFF